MTAKADTSSSVPSLSYGGAFDVDQIIGTMTSFGISAWLGMRYHGQGDGWIELALPWSAEIAADEESGVLASGPIISLLDNACGMAVWQKRGVLLPQVTVDLRIDYMRAAVPGRTVIGRGECYKLTRSVGFVRGIAYDERPEDPVAHVAGTFILLNGEAA